MSLEQKVMIALKAAMKAKDQARLRSVRAIKSAILLAKTDGSGKELDEAGEIKLLQKLVKQRKESISIFEAQGRDDLATIEKEEVEVISEFLPKQMDDSELLTILQEIVNNLGATSMRDMGKVMGAANKKLAGRADGGSISKIVKELLSGK